MPAMQCGAEKAERNRTYTVLPNLRSMVDRRDNARMDIEKHGVIQSGHGGKERNMRPIDADALRNQLIKNINLTNGFDTSFRETATIVPAERSET